MSCKKVLHFKALLQQFTTINVLKQVIICKFTKKQTKKAVNEQLCTDHKLHFFTVKHFKFGKRKRFIHRHLRI